MARPQKTGIDYLPLDVDIDSDDKIELIEAEFGLKGFAIIIKLFCKVYKEGYFYKWGDKEQLLFAKRSGESGGLVDEVVKRSIKWGIFDESLFNKFQILTSPAIQKRYFEAVIRRNRVEINEEFILIPVNEYKNLVNVNINSINVNINPQSKEEYSKEEKSKGKKHSVGDSHEPPPDKFSKFSIEIKELYKRIYKQFDPKHIPKTEAGIEKWLNVLRLANKDYPIKQLEEIIIYARNDSFWKQTFLSLNSLRKRNDSGIMKIDSIVAKMESVKPKPKVKPKLNLKKGENV